MKPVIVFGTNDVSQLAAFYLEQDGVNVAGFCVDKEYLGGRELVHGKPIFAFNGLSPVKYDLFIPLYDNKLRAKKSKEAKMRGHNLISYVSPKATVFSSVGENCFIMENNTIQPFVEIGNNVIMWSGNHIGHHSKIKDNVFFSSHVVLSGNCVVEPYCWLGVNSTIRDHCTLAEGTFVAMCAGITKNTKSYTKYAGMPAKEFGNVEA